jgi:hypothetical protein
MVEGFILLWSAVTGLFRSRARLEAEVLVLRHQINVLRRNSRKRFVFGTFDRLVFVGLYRLVPDILDALALVRPETVVRWHRAGFRSFWRWRSRRRGGRPRVPLEIPKLIRDMSLANPLWGRLASMANCSSSASLSARRALPSTWPGGGEGHHKAGEPFYAIMLTASPQLTCLSCRHSPSGCCMASWSCGTVDVESRGWG